MSIMNGGVRGTTRALSHASNTCTDLACLLPVQVALAAAVLRRSGESTGFHILGYPKPTAASRARFRSRTLHGRSDAILALPIAAPALQKRTLWGWGLIRSMGSRGKNSRQFSRKETQ